MPSPHESRAEALKHRSSWETKKTSVSSERGACPVANWLQSEASECGVCRGGTCVRGPVPGWGWLGGSPHHSGRGASFVITSAPLPGPPGKLNFPERECGMVEDDYFCHSSSLHLINLTCKHPLCVAPWIRMPGGPAFVFPVHTQYCDEVLAPFVFYHFASPSLTVPICFKVEWYT